QGCQIGPKRPEMTLSLLVTKSHIIIPKQAKRTKNSTVFRPKSNKKYPFSTICGILTPFKSAPAESGNNRDNWNYY
ncbi:MAG: hypothetical protein II704_05575, partial [Erysipelotrichaceae bacterium]|nr:hypothetical protein [Erysipelotrichaceae bacterium]